MGKISNRKMALAGICKTSQVLRFFKLSRCCVNFLPETQNKYVQYLFLVNNGHYTYYSIDQKPGTPGKPADPKTGQQAKKKKALTSPKITLILPDDEVHAMTLEQAEKLSKRRNLKLVKIVDFDTKTEKPVYKLMSSLEFFQENAKMKERKKKEKDSSMKETKLFTLSSKIGDHDVASKTRLMFKLLKKRHEVRVLISFDGNPARAEEIGKTIQEELVDICSISEQSSKSNTLKLVIKPKLENDPSASEDTTSKNTVEETDTSKAKATVTNVKT